jgi:hypothetical protein
MDEALVDFDVGDIGTSPSVVRSVGARHRLRLEIL